jgi:hypothetical protein
MSRSVASSRGWEHRRESAERVEVNVPPELVPLWRRTQSKYRGTPHQRFERFMHDAHDDERAAIVALEQEAERRLTAELARREALAPAVAAIPGNGEKLAWFDELDALQARTMRLRAPALASQRKKRKSGGTMAKKTKSHHHHSSLARYAPRTIKPVVIRTTKIVKAKKHGHRRSGGLLGGLGGGLLSQNRTQMVAAGAVVGFIDKSGWNVPKLPYLGEHGTIAVAAYLLSGNGHNKLADNVCTAALVLAGYEFAKTGSIVGEDGDFGGGI